MAKEFLSVKGITKKYGNFTAIDNVGIDIQ